MYEELLKKLDSADGYIHADTVTTLLKNGFIQPNQCAALLKIRGLQGDFNAVLELLELGVRIEKPEDKDAINTAIVRILKAAKWDERVKVWGLIFAGADIEKLSDGDVKEILEIPNPLHTYADKGEVKAVESIIEFCKDNTMLCRMVLMAQGREGNALHTAAHHITFQVKMWIQRHQKKRI